MEEDLLASGRLSSSTPTRLADGLGPTRLPYATGDTPRQIGSPAPEYTELGYIEYIPNSTTRVKFISAR